MSAAKKIIDITARLPLSNGLARFTEKALSPEEFQRQCTEATQREAAEIYAEQRRRASDAVLGRAAIPPRFMTKTLETYEPQSAEQARIKSAVEQYARDFGRDAGVTGASLILCGAPGTGKTHLGCAVANELLKQGLTALYTTATALVRDIRSTWAKDSERTEIEVLKAFIAPDLLIIDEIGVQVGSADEKIRLFDVINARYEQVKPMLIISNLDVTGVVEYLGERAADRLRENGGQALAFTWNSYRKNQTQESAQ